MTSQEKALLVLKTSDLTFDQTNSVGSANATGTKCTWNNINLRVLLGNLYSKYDRFNLCLNTFTTGPLVGVVPDADTGTYITLSGLPFVSNTYGVKTNSLNNEVILGSVLWKPQTAIAATTSSTSTSFIGSIAANTLTVNSFGYSGMFSVTGGTTGSSVTLTITNTLTAIPVGSVITGQGIVGYTTITAQTAANTYTMSTAQTITAGTLITVNIPNPICLPIGATITGNGIQAGTTISAQTAPYAYTLNNAHVISTMPMTSTVSTTIAASTTTYCNDIKYYENSRVTFTKNQDVCNLTLNIKKVSNDALPTTTYPNMILIFDIYGCDEYRVDDVTNSRILK